MLRARSTIWGGQGAGLALGSEDQFIVEWWEVGMRFRGGGWERVWGATGCGLKCWRVWEWAKGRGHECYTGGGWDRVCGEGSDSVREGRG